MIKRLGDLVLVAWLRWLLYLFCVLFFYYFLGLASFFSDLAFGYLYMCSCKEQTRSGWISGLGRPSQVRGMGVSVCWLPNCDDVFVGVFGILYGCNFSHSASFSR